MKRTSRLVSLVVFQGEQQTACCHSRRLAWCVGGLIENVSSSADQTDRKASIPADTTRSELVGIVAEPAQ